METRNQNLIRCRTKSFQDIFKATVARNRSSSSVQNLAGKLYSRSINREFTPNKSIRDRAWTATGTRRQKAENHAEGAESNPELAQSQSSVMNGLTMRASYVPCYAEINTQLLRHKKQLERKIAVMKQSIIRHNNNANSAQHQAKKYVNQIDKCTQMYRETESKNQRLQTQSKRLQENIQQLQTQIGSCNKTIQQRKQLIKELTLQCEQLSTQTRNMKVSLLQEEKQRINLKGTLASQQKVMTSQSIRCKELQAEKAMLLVQVNHSVAAFKFE